MLFNLFLDMGRTASNYYIKYNTVEVFNEMITSVMNFEEIFNMISQAQEFDQLKVCYLGFVSVKTKEGHV